MKFLYRWRYAAGILAAAVMLSGCQGGIPIISQGKAVEGYSLPQAMIVAATERNRYENIYSDQIWGVAVDDQGKTMESYMKEQVESFLTKLKTISLLAEEKEIQLDGAEQGKVAQLAEEYYQGLTEGDIAYMGATQEDVQTMYGEYCLANKVVTELTKDIDLEVSDSEAKVIELQQIEVWNEETANAVWEKTQEEGADFEAIAEEYSLNPEINVKLARGEGDSTLEEAAFALQAGEISGVIQTGQVFYIVKCINDYDEEATRERKAELEVQKKQQIFQQIYEEFAQTHSVTFADGFWDQVTFTGTDTCTSGNFFELYETYFPAS